MAITSKTNKRTSKNPTNKSSLAISKEKLSTLPKNNFNKGAIISPY